MDMTPTHHACSAASALDVTIYQQFSLFLGNAHPSPPSPSSARGTACSSARKPRLLKLSRSAVFFAMASSNGDSTLLAAAAVGAVTLALLLYKLISRATPRAVAAPEPAPPAAVPPVAMKPAPPPSAGASAEAAPERLVVHVKNGRSMTACCMSCDGCTLATASDVTPCTAHLTAPPFSAADPRSAAGPHHQPVASHQLHAQRPTAAQRQNHQNRLRSCQLHRALPRLLPHRRHSRRSA